jgi:predicted RNase H-like HicB family nuclease
MRYTVLVDGKAGAYGVVVPDLPGCHAMGKTIEVALDNAQKAMRDWIELTEEEGRSIPAPRSIEKLRRDRERAADPGIGKASQGEPVDRLRCARRAR